MASYILLAIGILFLAMFLLMRDKKGSIMATLIKTATSLLFIAVAVSAMIDNPNNTNVLLPMGLIIFGLLMGLVGDILLDLKVYFKSLAKDIGTESAEKDSDQLMSAGMMSFGAGHILYIAAMALLAVGQDMNLLWSAIGAVVFTAILFIVSTKCLKMQFGKFLIPSIMYSILLSWFVGLTAANVATDGATTENVIFLVASIMFLVSDLILSMTYFSKNEDYQREGMWNPESKFMICANHFTYYAAQFLIAIALLYV